MDRLKRDMDDALSTLRYTHLKTLTHLIARRNALNAQDKTARQKRDQWFPQSMLQYHHITDRDVQLRVARFLNSSATDQEKMMDEFKWPYRAVQPLLTAYKASVGPTLSFWRSPLTPSSRSSRSRPRSTARSAGSM